ncbi:hypothetical protein LOAG_11832 [Loa loa]|uniref:Uncharacterized protein n=1 Tax=Loa loa TaxID=7209 RepID=A0A1I7V826_LOALO|nr:hypothetical protein LOAG_11832 [Loa loa]EFO16674.1 hypothetical protein LOAG_11832 [Loa loa]
MLAPIITKDMNPFPSQPRKTRDIRIRSQSSDVSKISKSANRNQDIITEKSSQQPNKLKSTFAHSSSLSKHRILPSIVEGVEMRLNLEISDKYHNIEGGDNADSGHTSLPTASGSTLIMVTTTTTTVTTTLASSTVSDSSLSSITAKTKSTVKKIQRRNRNNKIRKSECRKGP